jgi:hypothetical protein
MRRWCCQQPPRPDLGISGIRWAWPSPDGLVLARMLCFVVLSIGVSNSGVAGMLMQGYWGLGHVGLVLPLVLYPVDDRRSWVEVGSSRAAAELLSLVLTVSCTTTLHAMHEAWWWRSFAPEFFCGRGSGEISVGWSDPDVGPLSSCTISSWRASWEAPVYFTLSRVKP